MDPAESLDAIGNNRDPGAYTIAGWSRATRKWSTCPYQERPAEVTGLSTADSSRETPFLPSTRLSLWCRHAARAERALDEPVHSASPGASLWP